MGAQIRRAANTDDDQRLRAEALEWVIDAFSDMLVMDNSSRHVLTTFLEMAGDRQLRATLIDDGTLVLGIRTKPQPRSESPKD